jgi:hypothetical protein
MKVALAGRMDYPLHKLVVEIKELTDHSTWVVWRCL